MTTDRSPTDALGSWMDFDSTARHLGMTATETARLLLSGDLRFTVSPDARGRVLAHHVLIDQSSIEAFANRRWGDTLADAMRADDLVNRAALKHGLHPTRTSPGVRGKARAPKETEE